MSTKAKATKADNSFWAATASVPRFPKVQQDHKVDVVVVGAGITGITAAYLLRKAGKKVALLERGHCAQVDTGHTTAHLTYVTDIRLHQLVKTFGRDHAQAAWDAGRAAIEQIYEISEHEDLACDFSWVPGFLHGSLTETDADSGLREDAALAGELGFDATFIEDVPLVKRPGVRFANQAIFHPLKYLAGLVERIPENGSHVFEHSEPDEFLTDPPAVRVQKHTIRCEYLVIATHVPLMGNTSLPAATLFQSKLAGYSSYAIGAEIPKGKYPAASFWATSSPYYYLRIDDHPRYDYAIFGGEDHKTGQKTNTGECFESLQDLLVALLPEAKVDHRWSGQVIETNDKLPLIGEMTARQFIATGFAGNGMTFGTLAGMMARDAVTGRTNPWQELFDPHRKKLRGGTWAREQGLSLLHAPRPAGGRRRDVARQAPARPRENPQARRPAGRRVSRSGRQRDDVVARVHAHGLHRPLEQGGIDLGLSLPRLSLPGDRRGTDRPRRSAAGKDRHRQERAEEPESVRRRQSEVGPIQIAVIGWGMSAGPSPGLAQAGHEVRFCVRNAEDAVKRATRQKPSCGLALGDLS
jgi:glycine/D-amino acid oxidase-like deaminating enzyme